ncbi:MAG: hypothetical protein RR490_06300 [Niameybacter sp.]
MNKIVEVSFEKKGQGKSYAFKNDIEGLEIGDTVVVDTRFGVSIAYVTKFLAESVMATKFLIQKVDLDAHKERLEKEQKLTDIKAKMEARRKELQELEVYQTLAKGDPVMASILAELDNL